MTTLSRNVIHGDCIEVMTGMEANSVDAIVTDPPYNLHFMGKDWDKDLLHERWLTEAYRVLKPGGSALVMGGTRTFHRLACAMEDTGFIIKDCLMWIYGSGFPKAQDLGKMIDKRGGDSDGWDGFKIGGIKPAYEPILWAVKPPEGAYIDNVLKWGVGAVNVDECRIEVNDNDGNKRKATGDMGGSTSCFGVGNKHRPETLIQGRFPANVILDEEAGRELDLQSGTLKSGDNPLKRSSAVFKNCYAEFQGQEDCSTYYSRKADSGGASRFFYCAKSSRSERNAGLEGMPLGEPPASARSKPAEGRKNPLGEPRQNNHPTVKPISLMSWLIKLVTREGQIVLDPFLGSGTTGISAAQTGREFIGIEREAEYLEIAEKRIAHHEAQPQQMQIEVGVI